MKKNDYSKKELLKRHRHELKRKKKQRVLRALNRKLKDTSIYNEEPSKLKGIPKRVVKNIYAPTVLSFETNFQATINYLNQIRLIGYLGHSAKVRIILKHVKKISMEACIVLTAEIQHIFDQKKFKKIEYVSPASQDVHSKLIDLGFYKHFGREYPKMPNKTLFLQTCASTSPQPTIASDLVKIFKAHTGMTHTAGSRLYEALLESMVNVNHHAYPDQTTFTRWWLMGAYNKSTKRAKFTFFDKGVTIPVSLRKYIEGSRIEVMDPKTWMSKPDDELVKQAVLKGYSRTKQTTRGKGLPSLKNFLNDENINGELKIYSGRGKITVKSNETDVHKLKLNQKLHGTLISWEISL